MQKSTSLLVFIFIPTCGREWCDFDELMSSNVYVWQISFDIQLQIQSVTWRFRKQKRLSINIYIFF
jgi:hypothetical protein